MEPNRLPTLDPRLVFTPGPIVASHLDIDTMSMKTNNPSAPIVRIRRRAVLSQTEHEDAFPKLCFESHTPSTHTSCRFNIVSSPSC